MSMMSLATLACPQCMKIYITKIVIKEVITGGRPILIFPVELCDGLIGEEVCGFDFQSLQVESFDIPIKMNSESLIKKP